VTQFCENPARVFIKLSKDVINMQLKFMVLYTQPCKSPSYFQMDLVRKLPPYPTLGKASTFLNILHKLMHPNNSSESKNPDTLRVQGV
jgi:hypothetical protein